MEPGIPKPTTIPTTSIQPVSRPKWECSARNAIIYEFEYGLTSSELSASKPIYGVEWKYSLRDAIISLKLTK